MGPPPSILSQLQAPVPGDNGQACTQTTSLPMAALSNPSASSNPAAGRPAVNTQSTSANQATSAPPSLVPGNTTDVLSGLATAGQDLEGAAGHSARLLGPIGNVVDGVQGAMTVDQAANNPNLTPDQARAQAGGAVLGFLGGVGGGIGGAAVGGATGAAEGGGEGAILGSIAPGAGTVVGGLIGAGAGGTMGAIGGGYEGNKLGTQAGQSLGNTMLGRGVGAVAIGVDHAIRSVGNAFSSTDTSSMPLPQMSP
jgi:hypothetical protein